MQARPATDVGSRNLPVATTHERTEGGLRTPRAEGSSTAHPETAFVTPRTGSKPGGTGEQGRSGSGGGLLPPLDHPEAGVIGSLLYPLRGAESLAMTLFMGFIFWALTFLVPEYCLGIWADATSLGTPSMGMLVILISVIPAILLCPLLLSYILQYLGRVLVSSAQGDCAAPRLPDRDFEGIFSGLGPWLIWLVLGAGVGLAPCAWLDWMGGRVFHDRPFLSSSLLLLGVTYAFTSLMLSFLHDRPLACAPGGVALALWQDGATLLPALVKAAALLGLSAALFHGLFTLRAQHFWIYLMAALPGWVLTIWTAIVEMRLLGLQYYRHKDILKWHGMHPRWGVRWRL